MLKDLKHLIYFEKLLENSNNELIQQAKSEGKLAVGYTCFHMPEVLLNLDKCFSVRLRAPKTGSMDIATYYMSNYTCEYCRALLERAIEGGLNFLDALAGVDALLVVTPYYNKATQEGLVRHYYAVADAVGLPLIVYHVPSRTGVTIAPETYAELSRHPQIVGVKEASGNFGMIQKTRELCPEDFYLWSGNDEDTAAICLLGGKGVISVAANVMPRAMHDLTAACLRGDFVEAGEMQLHLRRLIEVLFREVNPIPVKTALSLMDYCQDILGLPLSRLSPAHRLELEETLADYGLI